MTIDKLLVIGSSVLGIIFTYWFFLMKKEKKALVVEKNSVDIIVKGGYQPETISIKRGRTTRLNFLRKDSSSCLEDVVLGDFKIKKFLPLNKKVTIEISPQKAGQYNFTCGMGMFHGKIIVE